MSIASSSPPQGPSPVASPSTANPPASLPAPPPAASSHDPPTPEPKALLSTSNVPTSKTRLTPSSTSERSPESATRPPLSKVSTSRSIALSAAGLPPSKSNPSSPSSPAASTTKHEPQPSQSENPASTSDAPAVPAAAPTANQPPPPPLKTWYPPRPSRASAASDADSPTLGLGDKVQFRTISQVSAEKPPSSLEEAAQGQSHLDTVARLTVHQNQMESFGASFPPDLVMPAVPTIPAEYQKGNGLPKHASLSAERDTKTPTQADYNARASAAGNSTHTGKDNVTRSGPHVFPSRTVSRKPPKSDLRAIGPNLPGNGARNSQLAPGRGRNGALNNHESRPFSFIQFDDVHSEQFAIQTPVTPKASNFELNKMYGQGLRPSRPGPPTQPVDMNVQETASGPPKTRPSGRRKPSSSSRSRDNSASSLHRKGSETETPLRQAAPSNRFHSPENHRLINADNSPPSQRPQGRKGSRRSFEQHPSIKESPEISAAPLTRAGTSPMHHQESPVGNKRQRHHSLLKGLGIRTSPESFRTQMRAQPKLEETTESQQRAPLEPKDSNQSVLTPAKTKSVADHGRSVSANILNHAAAAGQPPEKGKRRRFSSLGSLFMKPSPRKSSLMKSNLGPPPQEQQAMVPRDEDVSEPLAAASAYQVHFQKHPPPTSHHGAPSPGHSPKPPPGTHTDDKQPPATESRSTPPAAVAKPFQPQKEVADPSSATPHPGANPKQLPLVNVHPAFRPDTSSSTADAKEEIYDDNNPPPPPPKDAKHQRQPSAGTPGHQRQPSGSTPTHQRQLSGSTPKHQRQPSAPGPPRAKTQPTTPSPQRERPRSLLSAFPTPPSAKSGSSPTRASGREQAGGKSDEGSGTGVGSPERRRQHHQSLPPLNVIGKSKAVTTRTMATHAEEATPTDEKKNSEVRPPGDDNAPKANGVHVESKAPEDEPETPKPAKAANETTKTDPPEERAKAPPVDDDEEIVMSSTSYPGQEWQPTIGAWEGD